MARKQSPITVERIRLAPLGLKRCSAKSGCGKILPLANFARETKAPDGLRIMCKPCDSLYNATRRHGSREKALASFAEFAEVKSQKGELASRGLKRCISTGCGTVKPVSEFHKNSDYSDGLNPRCKSCNKAGAKRWYGENPDRSLAYRQGRREHTRLYCGALRAAGAGNRVDEFAWPDLLDYWSKNSIPFDRCYLCGEEGVYEGREGLHIDHVIPIARGGAHAMDNLRPACAPCNHMKHSSTLDEYRDRVVRTASFLLSDN